MQDLITLQSSAFASSARVVGFRGHEAISTLYRFELYLLLPGGDGADLDLGDAIGCKATLKLEAHDGTPPFQFHGVLGSVEILHDTGELTLVRATLVPRFWRLSLSQKSRMFTKQSVPEILKAVFEDAGLPSDSYSLQLVETYAPQEHVCQYHESDFDFVSRWMEHEGIYYFFDHEGGDKLVITDKKSSHQSIGAPIRYRALAALGQRDGSARDALHAFTCRRNTLPSDLRLKDYDYTKPTLEVTGKASVSKLGHGDVSVYGARFFTPDEGARFAALRVEELRADEILFKATGTARFLRSGFLFELQEHPRAAFDAKYLATAVEHYANQAASTPELRSLTGLEEDELYRVGVKAIPESVQYRARRVTPWPRVYGFENATIDGADESDYAQLDDHGRYRVRFLFDESELPDGRASTWVRMMQPHGGGIEGFHFPLRKGTEVVVTFLGGDPDRPVIAGVVNTTHTPSPVTSANRTKNVIQTGGKNRLEIEDKKGQERITLSTPHKNTMLRMGAPNAEHELIVRTDGSSMLHAGQNFDVTIHGNKTEYVNGTTSETFHGKHETFSQSERVVDNVGAYTETNHANITRIGFADSTTTISGNVAESCASRQTEVSGAAQTHADAMFLKGDSVVQVVSPKIHVFGGSEIHLQVGGSAIEITDGGIKISSAGPVQVNGSFIALN
jgi:type VI secretion system secreted protein VgrG